MSPACRVAAVAVAFAAVATAGCGGSSETRGILFVTLDTTRADRLGAYGHARAKTANLDAFAADSVLFREAMSPVPVTLPSHSTMFTGTYPPRHGVRYNGMFELPPAAHTLAEMLAEAGWRTGAVPASFPVHLGTGIEQGFADYLDLPEPSAGSGVEDNERKADAVADLGIAWLNDRLEEPDAKPFFLWLHFFDAHYPYEPPFPYSATFRDHPYDGEIAFMDAQVGRVFEFLRERGVWDDTIVVVAGDHGEGLYDHGEKMHANLVYQSTLHVPLMIRAPGRDRGVEISEPVSLADLTPTLLDLLGRDVPAGLDGVSLRGALDGREPERRPLYFESLAGALVYGWHPLEGVRRGPWKWTRSSEPELFDLETDPGERTNRVASEGTRAADLAANLDEFERAWNAAGEDPGSVAATPVDPETLDRLASLGYVGGNLVETRRAGRAPASLIHLEGDVFLARDLYHERRYDDALDVYDRILAEDPDNRHALQGAASSAVAAGRPDVAEARARRNLDLYPEFVPSRLLLADLAVSRADYAGAESLLREGLTRSSGDPALRYKLALALYAQDRADEALTVLDDGIAAGTDSPSYRLARAACLAKAGRGDEALDELREAIAKGYRDVEVLRQEPLLAPLRRLHGFDALVGGIGTGEAAS